MEMIKNSDQIKYLTNKDLLNINEIRWEIIHLAADHCFRYVDTTFFTVLSVTQLRW